MPSIGAKLDIERDAGLLLAQATEAEDRAEVFEELKVLSQTATHEFDDLTALREAGVSRWGALYQNAKFFFENVHEAFVTGGDVYYRMNFDSPLSQSGLLYVDHVKTPENLWRLVTAQGAAEAGAAHLAMQMVSAPRTVDGLDDVAALNEIGKNFPGITPANLVRTLARLEGSFTPELQQAVLRSLAGVAGNAVFQLVERLIAAKSDSHMTDAMFARGLTGFEKLSPPDLTEAMEWFCSKELSWMDGHEKNRSCERNCNDKIKLILASFDEKSVSSRWKKFEGYFASSDYETHQQMAQEILTSFRSGTDSFLREAFLTGDPQDKKNQERAQLRMEEFLGRMEKFCDESIIDMISLFIMIESQGKAESENPVGNGLMVGLMQVGMDKFPPGMSVKKAKEPRTNLKYGMRYFLTTCLDGDKRNPQALFSLSVSNYNMGPDNSGSYRLGRMSIPEETQNYLRDLVIYERFKSDIMPEHVIFNHY